MFRSLDPDVWFLDKPFSLFGVELGGRMTVVRLLSKDLLVVSPVKLSGEERAELDRLGAVRHIVLPNLFHHLHAVDFFRNYPDATLYAPPGIAKKNPDLARAQALENTPVEAWTQDLEQHVVQGMPRLAEAVLFHKKSRTLVVTDLLFNFRQATSLWAKLFLFINGALGGVSATRMLRSLVADRLAVRRSLQEILKWDFERMIVAHGDVVRENAKAQFSAAYAFLLDSK